jgi:two-component system, OmpR family, response regulator TctD
MSIGPNANGKRMLIVDDERVITFALQNYFVELGFIVDCAGESEEALALLTHKDYDIVIADLRLTGTTSEEGLEVVRLARERSSSVSIILLTAYRTGGVQARASALGADALLQKPKPLPELAQTVFALMESR